MDQLAPQQWLHRNSAHYKAVVAGLGLGSTAADHVFDHTADLHTRVAVADPDSTGPCSPVEHHTPLGPVDKRPEIRHQRTSLRLSSQSQCLAFDLGTFPLPCGTWWRHRASRIRRRLVVVAGAGAGAGQWRCNHNHSRLQNESQSVYHTGGLGCSTVDRPPLHTVAPVDKDHADADDIGDDRTHPLLWWWWWWCPP